MSYGYVLLDRPGTAIRKYGCTGTGIRTVVKIEIEVTDPHELGWLLEELAGAQREVATRRAAAAQQEKAEKKAAQQEKAAKTKPAAIGRQVLLGLPYYGGKS